MFVYDITNATSFENLEDWYGIVRKIFKECGDNEKTKLPHMALIGNKC